MIIYGSAGRNRKACLSTHCETLTLKAQTTGEAMDLALLRKALVDDIDVIDKIITRDKQPIGP
jgi:hypothetical protein